jgi:hypothetical protein
MKEDLMFIFLSGNLSDGYAAFGPYETFGEAATINEWQDGWVMELQTNGAGVVEL